jgi:hypothetical protein
VSGTIGGCEKIIQIGMKIIVISKYTRLKKESEKKALTTLCVQIIPHY